MKSLEPHECEYCNGDCYDCKTFELINGNPVRKTRYTKLEDQIQYCTLNDKTMWIPKDGICVRCHDDILKNHSMKKCSTQAITRCSCCNKSYVD